MILSLALHDIPVPRQLYCRYAQRPQLAVTMPLYAIERCVADNVPVEYLPWRVPR